MGNKRAMVTGITGQCGRYLTELLLSEGYEVFGLVRRTSNISTNRISHLLDKITLIGGDLTDEASLIHALEIAKPDEVYNLAAQSLVPVSWDQPILTAEVTGVGVAKLLAAIKTINPKIKFLQMSSSEMFGLVREIPQTELTPLYPRSPYAVAKCFTEGTKIYTDKGLVKIKDIKEGDLVWTHTGQLKKVTEIYKRKYKGKLFNIIASPSTGSNYGKVTQTNFQITATPEHPVLTERGWVCVSELKEDDKISVVATSCKCCGTKIPANRIYCCQSCTLKDNWKNNEDYRNSLTEKIKERAVRTNCLHSESANKKKTEIFAKRLKKAGKNHMEYYVDLLIQNAAPGFFKFVGDGKLSVAGYFPDWINEDKKAIIEFFGWGEGLERRETQVAKKIQTLESLGYKILLIRGSEFTKPDQIKEKVAKFCSDLGSLEYIFVPVKKITSYEMGLEKYVYNLEVEDDHSYVANGVVAHNCFGHWTTINHRESYNMFAATSICFNFESPHRGLEFVTKKITDGVAKIVRGETKELRLGNIYAKRDWSYAGDVVRAMHMIMQHSEPDDFVVSTGETHSVEEFLEIAFGYFNLNYRDYVVIDPNLIRPAEVPLLLGDSTKIKTKLGWEPKVKFHDLVNMMIEHELSGVKK